jgi:hypothetical protein
VRVALVVTRFPEEGPVVSSVLLKVFLFEPAGRFVRVSSSSPLPQTNEDGVVNAGKDAFTHHVPMIIGPNSYFGVEPTNQIGGRHAQRSFDSWGRPNVAVTRGNQSSLAIWPTDIPVERQVEVLQSCHSTLIITICSAARTECRVSPLWYGHWCLTNHAVPSLGEGWRRR